MKRLMLSVLIFAVAAFGQIAQPPLTATTDTVSVYAFNNHDLAPVFAGLHIGPFQPAVFFIIVTTDNTIEAYRITISYDDDNGNPQSSTTTIDRARTPIVGTQDPPSFANFQVSAAARLRYAVTPLIAFGAVAKSN